MKIGATYLSNKLIDNLVDTLQDVFRARNSIFAIHWNGNVFILMKFTSLAALQVVKMTTSNAAND